MAGRRSQREYSVFFRISIRSKIKGKIVLQIMLNTFNQYSEQKVEDKLHATSVVMLKELNAFFSLRPRSRKEDLVEQIFSFLKNPSASEVVVREEEYALGAATATPVRKVATKNATETKKVTFCLIQMAHSFVPIVSANKEEGNEEERSGRREIHRVRPRRHGS